MSEVLIGIRFDSFVLLAASGTSGHYYIKFTDTDDKIVELDDRRMIAVGGSNGSRVQFSTFVKANTNLDRIRHHGDSNTTPAVANWMRSTLAGALRSRGGAYEVNTLLAGFDDPAPKDPSNKGGSHLYYMDYMGTLQDVPYACHGYGGTFVMALLDRHYRPDMNSQDAVNLLQTCVDEVKNRVMMSNNHFFCKAVSASGTEVVNVH